MPVLETVTALLAAGGPPVTVPDARFAVAVYCQETCDIEEMQTLEAKLSKRFEIKNTLPRQAERDRLALSLMSSTDFGRPDAEYLDAFGSGLSAADAGALGTSLEVVLMEAAVPAADAAAAQALLNAAALEFAGSEGGWLEDLETREVFSRDAWKRARVDALAGSPKVWELVRVESYPEGGEGLERVVTFGLNKFGLHEISASGVPAAFSDDLSAALLLMAAQGVEGRPFTDSYALNLDGLSDPAARTWLSEYRWQTSTPGVIQPGTGQATVRLVSATPQEGDNPTPQVQLVTEGDRAENLGALLDTLWGYGQAPAPEAVVADASGALDLGSYDDGGDEAPVIFIVVPDSGDAALTPLEQASADAREALGGEVRARWDAGLPAGSRLAVKGPFTTAAGGVEWMWVEVERWDGDRLTGALLNQPDDVPGLRKGARVAVSLGDVFDYLLRGADGRTEGGATEALLR